MTDLTEKQIDDLCVQAGDHALQAVGNLTAGLGPELQHICLMAAASSLMGVAAQTVVRMEFNEHPPPDDPRVVALFHVWADALKAYPDRDAIAQAMTLAREQMASGAVIPRWYEATPEVRRLMEQIASCRDPLANEGENIDEGDCVETLSKIIRGAKSIVGDLEEPEQEDGDDDR